MHFDKSLLDKLTKLKHIPTLPHILLQLIKTCNADSGSLKEISRIIEKDPALTSRDSEAGELCVLFKKQQNPQR